MTYLKILLLCGLFLAGTVWSGDQNRLQEVGGAAGMRLAGSEDSTAPKVYIVQLKQPSAAEYHASMTTAVSRRYAVPGPASRLDKTNPVIESYSRQLADAQDAMLAGAGPGVEKIYGYQYALNGFAARMTVAQAHKLENRSDVLNVWEDEIRPLTTTHSRSFLGLFDKHVGLRGSSGLDGDGVVIGVIDSGITPEHPALNDKREAERPQLCRSTWAKSSLLGKWLCNRFSRQPDVLSFEAPENWNGICQTGVEFTEEDCNNKLIGARYFVAGAQATGALDSGEIFSPRDVDGHGTHTATTAAGNKVKASIFGTFLGNVEGMAPKARVSAYKACWLRPGDTRASCNTSDLANAIDAAVADGVHIINYSVGSSLRVAVAPDDIALMAATKAGVLSVVSAGNDGPNLGTIGSPAGGPWVITAAASSREGQHSLEALQVVSPANVAGKYAVREAGFTPALSARDPLEGNLVLVDDDDTSLDGGGTGTVYDGCQALINDTDVSGHVAFMQRGGCTFETKISNAEDAGAVAAVIFNIAGAPIVMTGLEGSVDIPALMIGQADGELLRDEIDAALVIEVALDKGLFLTEQDTGNVMGVFSSRGPGPVEDILKPDVTAPGINILAGNSPDAVNDVSGEKFSFRTGTSMSTPHIAGVAALLRQAHPGWTPAEIKSALMTTAYQGVDQQDGVTPAIGFDFGSGHVDPNKANDPGLVYDITDDEYDAFACGSGSPAVDQTRCDALSAAGMSFAGSDLNQPSIAVARLASTRTVTRRVTNVSDTTETYIAVVVPPPGIDVVVNPGTLSVGPGQMANYDVTMNYLSGPMSLWRFGSLTWSSSDHEVRSVLATKPVPVTAPAEVSSFGGTGSLTFPVEFGYSGTYTPGVHGLRRAGVFPGQVGEDPDKIFTFRNGNGVSVHLLNVQPNQAYARFALYDEFTDGDDDLDMYVYYSPDGVNFTQVGKSGGATAQEQVSLLIPAAGTYAVLVHGFDTDNVAGGAGSEYQLLAWEFGLNDDVGNMTATGPGIVNAGGTENVTIDWSNLGTDSIYLGGISHNTPQGLVSITVVSIRN